MNEYTDPQVNDIVQITRGAHGPSGMEWKVIAVSRASDQVYVDLARGSLLGPQWENRSDVTLVRRPGRETSA